jgi:Domain of unknown function (DUF222)/HNH endonuclease
VTDTAFATAHRLLEQAADAVSVLTRSGNDDELIATLALCEGAARRLDRAVVDAIAALERRGAFGERGYKSTAGALRDLLGWERFEARQRVVAAEQVSPRTGLDGSVLPPRLPATAAVFAGGAASLRHVDAIARVLRSPAAERLCPQQWAGAEQQLAAKAADYTPSELQTWGAALVEALDQDGDEPDDRPPAQVNELILRRFRGGGKLTGHFDDAAMFDRHRPHVNVLIPLEDLQTRARAACLDFGGPVSPEALRMLCCDAAVVPVVMNGQGQPLDVGRATRTIPDGLRRAVAARDKGCAHPGCDRPQSWTEIHHIIPWECGGETKLSNLVMVCRAHHRQMHFSEWVVRIHDGLPEFIPPRWLDESQTPRRKPLPHLIALRDMAVAGAP